MAKGMDPLNRVSALNAMEESKQQDQILTGLLYMDPDSKELHEAIGTVSRPLNQLSERELCPGDSVLQNINESLR